MESIKKQKAFSLVELLAVVAILVILLGLVVPGIQSIVNSYRLNSAGNQLAALIERARIHATVTQRVAVLRIYADPKTKEPSKGFRVMQVLEQVQDISNASQPLTLKPITRGYTPESPVMISQAQSSIFSNAGIASSSGSIHGVSDVPYREIYFFPNGSTSLEATPVNPYFTLVNAHDDVASPDHPFVVSLDPVTTRVTLFQR